MYHYFRFTRRIDGAPGWVLIRVTEDQSRMNILTGYGKVLFGHIHMNAMDAEPGSEKVFDMPKEVVRYDDEPTHQQCGSLSALDFHYRRALGNPLTIWELVVSKRLYLQPDRNPEYDGMTYLMRVVQMAAQTNRLDNFMSALARLCCRDDETIVMTQDSPFGSFFWRLLTRAEFEEAEDRYRRLGTWVYPGRPFYHGGLIGHAAWVDGKPTNILDWSVHT